MSLLRMLHHTNRLRHRVTVTVDGIMSALSLLPSDALSMSIENYLCPT